MPDRQPQVERTLTVKVNANAAVLYSLYGKIQVSKLMITLANAESRRVTELVAAFEDHEITAHELCECLEGLSSEVFVRDRELQGWIGRSPPGFRSPAFSPANLPTTRRFYASLLLIGFSSRVVKHVS